ncbi:MAG: hypothetical protein SAL07_09370 [Oscillatoria sp. PMC 1051.18]|nr:hypothetical protein [Oscillatoria sp. PMC 1050.18]MEC5030111.1 hypothetical protein [Oscillatoria sp. PMC 1051.18]
MNFVDRKKARYLVNKVKSLRILPKVKLAYLGLAIATLFFVFFSKNLLTLTDNSGMSSLPSEVALFTTTTNEVYEWKNVKIGGGGFVTGIVVHPTVPDIVYARTDVGGLYGWNSTNQSWRQLFQADNLPENIPYPPYSVESVAIAPSNPDLIYVATGAYTKSQDKLNPGYTLKSSDRGASWQLLNLSLPMGGNEHWRWTGERLAVDPHNQNIIYFASRLDGLWRSENGGETWNQIDPKMVPVGESHPDSEQKAGVTYVVFDPTSDTVNSQTQIIYAGVAGKGIYQTTDGGTSWKLLREFSSTDLVPQQGIVNNKGELFTTLYQRQKDSLGSVWKFTSTGWQDLTPETGKNYSAIAVDPHQPETIFVVTYPMTPNNIYRSEDGGTTWTTLKNTINKVSWYPDWCFYTLTGGIAISPFNSEEVWLTNGVGVWKTENSRDRQVKWAAVVNGIEEIVTFDGVSTPGGASLLTAIADFDGFRHDSLDSFPNRTHGREVFNTTTSITYSSGNPNFIVSVGASHHNFSQIRAGFSTNNGKTWQQFPSLEKGTHPNELIFGNVAVSATDINNIVWQPTNWKPPYFTKDRGKTWQRIDWFTEGDLGGGAHTHLWNSQQILAADPVRGSTFYLYHHVKGRMLRSDNGGETWQIVNEMLPEGVWKGAKVNTAPGMAGEVWVSLKEKGLYRSRNFGEEFVKVANVDEAQVFGFGKAAPGVNHPTVFLEGKVAGESGVFRSTDLGKTWLRIADYPQGYLGDFNVLVGDLNVFGRVFLGTSGNGFIYGEPQTD